MPTPVANQGQPWPHKTNVKNVVSRIQIMIVLSGHQSKALGVAIYVHVHLYLTKASSAKHILMSLASLQNGNVSKQQALSTMFKHKKTGISNRIRYNAEHAILQLDTTCTCI